MLPFTIDLAKRAGAVLREGATRPRTVERKGPFDLVTDVDRASETLVVAAIREQFPDHAVLAEEGGGVERESAWLWIIDPLDGTNNYAHNFPYYCVSLALLHEKKLFLGVIYDPNRDEVFAAQQGDGATCNGVPIHVSSAPVLGDSLISTGFPYDFADNPHNNAPEFTRVHRYVQGIRRAGSAALDLANVACGRLDAHWELGLKPWDGAAGALLVQEAGGRVTDRDGGQWTPWSASMIATNGHIHSELSTIINQESEARG